jgi:hypothetical protein
MQHHADNLLYTKPGSILTDEGTNKKTVFEFIWSASDRGGPRDLELYGFNSHILGAETFIHGHPPIL